MQSPSIYYRLKSFFKSQAWLKFIIIYITILTVVLIIDQIVALSKSPFNSYYMVSLLVLMILISGLSYTLIKLRVVMKTKNETGYQSLDLYLQSLIRIIKLEEELKERDKTKSELTNQYLRSISEIVILEHQIRVLIDKKINDK